MLLNFGPCSQKKKTMAVCTKSRPAEHDADRVRWPFLAEGKDYPPWEPKKHIPFPEGNFESMIFQLPEDMWSFPRSYFERLWKIIYTPPKTDNRKSTIWRCISYWTWWFSNVIWVFKGLDSPWKNTNPNAPFFMRCWAVFNVPPWLELDLLGG